MVTATPKSTPKLTKAAKVLAKKIKIARQEMGLKQADLAYRMGISAQLISAFENGRIKPTQEYLEKIAQFTHKPFYFFTGQKVTQAIARIDQMMQELQEIRNLLTQVTEAEDD